ncbi:MAG: dTMP kinase [Egibacteraceae bacterium]
MAVALPPDRETTEPGFFVCLEGIDGAGKTTAIAVAGEILRRRGSSVAFFDKKDAGFSSPYVERHMAALREIIWGHPPDDPYLELGDFHWVHLQAAWYSALAKCKVTPLLQAGNLVLTDTWAWKFLAKLRLREGVDFDRARAAFSGLIRPDLVILLRIDPRVAAARKTMFAASEAGNHEGAVELSAQAFTAYQQRLSAVLDEFARREGWVSLDVSQSSVEQVGHAVADRVAHHIATGRALQARGQAALDMASV